MTAALKARLGRGAQSSGETKEQARAAEAVLRKATGRLKKHVALP